MDGKRRREQSALRDTAEGGFQICSAELESPFYHPISRASRLVLFFHFRHRFPWDFTKSHLWHKSSLWLPTDRPTSHVVLGFASERRSMSLLNTWQFPKSITSNWPDRSNNRLMVMQI